MSILDIIKESINNSEYDFSNHEKFSKVIDFARNRVSKWTDILNESKYYKYADLLEDRKNLDYLILQIEQLNFKNKTN